MIKKIRMRKIRKKIMVKHYFNLTGNSNFFNPFVIYSVFTKFSGFYDTKILRSTLNVGQVD